MPTREEKIAEIGRQRKIAEIRAMSAPPKPVGPSEVVSGLAGAAQGATLGFADEIGGAAGALGGLYTGMDPRKLMDAYSQTRDKLRGGISEAQEANPKSYLAGNVAGGFASQAVPGLGIAKGTGALMSAGKAATQGALMGAGESLENPVSDPDQFESDIAKGAAFGGAAQLGLGAVGKAASALTPTSLRNLAEQRAVKAVTGQNVGALRKAAKTTLQDAGSLDRAESNIQRMGRDILDEGALSTFDKVSDVAPKLSSAKNKYGSQIGEIGSTIDRVAPNSIDTQKISKDLLEYADTIPGTEVGKKLQNRIKAEAANLSAKPGMGFGEAQDWKNQFKYKPMDQDALIGSQDVTNKIQKIIGKEMENAASRTSKTGSEEVKALLDQYQNAKSKYGSFKGSSSAATDRAIKDLSNRFVSPSDYAVGGMAAVPGLTTMNPGLAMAGIAGAMANKFARERGSSTVAVTADKLAKTMESSPTFAKEFGQAILDAMQRGPAALSVSHHLLMKNPKYRAEFEQQSDNIPEEEN